MLLPGKIAFYRKARGMTQDELAEALHVSRQSISKWESGKTAPDLDNVMALAKLFDVSMQELTREDPGSDSERDEAAAVKQKSRRKKPMMALWVTVALMALALVSLLIRNASLKRALQANEAETATEASVTADTPTPKSTLKPTPKPKRLTAKWDNSGSHGLANGDAPGAAVCKAQIYWAAPLFQIGLFRMNMDGSDITEICRDICEYVTAADNSVFYYSMTDSKIHRMDADGNAYASPTIPNVVALGYYATNLYYVRSLQNMDGPTSYYWERIGSDLTAPQQLFEFPVQPGDCCIYKDSVYYREEQQGKQVYVTEWETGVTELIYEGDFVSNICIDEDHLYLTDMSFLLDISLATGEEKLTPIPVNLGMGKGVADHKLLYAADYEPATFYYYDPETKEVTDLLQCSGMPWSCCVAGDWMFAYVQAYDDNNAAIGIEVSAVNTKNGYTQQFTDGMDIANANLSVWKDIPIEWKDPAVETCVRMALNKQEGDITLGDAASVTQLNFWANSIGWIQTPPSMDWVNTTHMICDGVKYPRQTVTGLEDLVWFSNLRVLHFEYGFLRCSLSPLSKLEDLEELWLCMTGYDQYDGDGLGQLKQVERLMIQDDRAFGLSALRGMTGLKKLELYPAPLDYEALGELPQLRSLFIAEQITRETYENLLAACPESCVIGAGYIPPE